MSYSQSQTLINLEAAAAIDPHTLLTLGTAADSTVQEAGDNEEIVGAVGEYAVASGDQAPVIICGVAQIKLGGAVTRGGQVKADASGQAVAVATTGTTNQNSAGKALKSGVSGDIIPILIQPQVIRPALV